MVTKIYGNFLQVKNENRNYRQSIIVSKDLVILDTT